MLSNQRAIAVAISMVGLCLSFNETRADNYPTRLVTILVPYSAGGTSDIFARIVAKGLRTRLGQTFIIENRPGAGGQLATQAVARSASDGYTLLVTNEAPITTGPSVRSKVPYDPINDFTPISIAATLPFFLVVRSDLAVKSVADLISLSKAKRGVLTYGSTGIGGVSHLVTEAFSSMNEIKLLHIPYKGGPEAMTDLIAGRIDLFFSIPSTAFPQLMNPKVRFLAVASSTRNPNAPHVPTFAEEGVADFVFGSWFGLLGPGKLPKDIVLKLNKGMVEILNEAETKKIIADQGADILASSPEEAAATIASDIRRWHQVANEANIKVD
jgi:tripartite-type tricarboxylate transporter receptor subunit TctC